MFEKAPILVTGATGTVGREVVRLLVAGGHPVRVTSRGDVADSLPQIETVFLDLQQRDSFKLALEGVERVFFSMPLAENMVDVAGWFIAAARDAGVRHVVRLSAFGVDREPPLELARVHGEVEKLLRDSEMEWTVLRPNSFMQNFISYCAASIREQAAFYIPQGNGRVSMVDVRDIAAVATKALIETGHAGKVYELTGPEALDNHAVAAHLSSVLGSEIHYVDASSTETRHALQSAGMPTWLVTVLMELYEYSRNGHAAGITETVSSVVGRNPKTFVEFAQDFADCFR